MFKKLKELFSSIAQRSISAYETLSSSVLSFIEPLIKLYETLCAWFSSNKQQGFPRAKDIAKNSALSKKTEEQPEADLQQPEADLQQPESLSLINPDSHSSALTGNESNHSSPCSRTSSTSSNT